MHEFAICRALIAQLAQVARDNDASRVSETLLDVGPLSGVVPEQLIGAFSIARAGTVAAEAVLTVAQAPVRVWCAACGLESAATVNRLICAQCGIWRTALRSADELLLRSVVLEGAEVQPEETEHV